MKHKMTYPTYFLSLLFLISLPACAATHKKTPPKKRAQTQKPVTPPTTIKEEPSRTITATNAITKKDLSARRFGSDHYPDAFSIDVNGKPVKNGASINVTGPRLTVRYRYKWSAPWPWGPIERAKQVTFMMAPHTNTTTITFAGWNATKRIALSNATQIDDEKLIGYKEGITI